MSTSIPTDWLDREQLASVAAYWRQRAQGEMTSWIGFRHVLDDLRCEGSPSPVIALAERAVADEYKHAIWCQDWARRFGYTGPDEVRPRGESAIAFRGASEAENRLLRIALCCMTETAGCFILRHARPLVTEPALKAQYRTHLADELQHSRVGWGHLASLDAGRRDMLAAWTPKLLRVLRSVICDGPEQDREDLVPFGYFTPRLLQAAHDEALSEVILPGLEHVGVKVKS
jgi:hypothetical protein